MDQKAQVNRDLVEAHVVELDELVEVLICLVLVLDLTQLFSGAHLVLLKLVIKLLVLGLEHLVFNLAELGINPVFHVLQILLLVHHSIIFVTLVGGAVVREVHLDLLV